MEGITTNGHAYSINNYVEGIWEGAIDNGQGNAYPYQVRFEPTEEWLESFLASKEALDNNYVPETTD